MLWFSGQEQLLHTLQLLDHAGDIGALRSLMVWLLQYAPRGFESVLLSAVRERELIFIASDSAPQLLGALYARLQQMWGAPAGSGGSPAKHVEKELAWYLLELLAKYVLHYSNKPHHLKGDLL